MQIYSKLDGALVSSNPFINSSVTVWIAAVTAAIYPWILDALHWAVTPPVTATPVATISTGATWLAALLLMAAFLIPLVSFLILGVPQQATTINTQNVRARRFALLAMTSPTAYVFFGVLTYMAGSQIPDTWLWTPAWLLFGYLASRSTSAVISAQPSTSSQLRVAHGITGSIAAAFVLFHIFNHLFGLISPEAHAIVMDIGRSVYRAKFVEPLLVAVMFFQIFSGLRLVWTWTETSVDRYRMFQIATGVFMSVFILGHMNSVFIFARTWLNIPTDWAFAAGLPTGLMQDAWSIRLLPHYALGVFFALAHLVSGLRVVMLAHNIETSSANKFWWAGVLVSVAISIAVMCGMTGLRIN